MQITKRYVDDRMSQSVGLARKILKKYKKTQLQEVA
jgi:hypothetical protein